jgi:deoxyadenosine/deoxycytidine kinase
VGSEEQARGASVVIVGPCAAGKSTLAAGLRAAGYRARAIAQEHSYVPGMWRRAGRPDVLIYLDVSLPALLARRPDSGFGQPELDEERRRLHEVRQRCQMYLDTTALTIDQVHAAALAFLEQKGQGPEGSL